MLVVLVAKELSSARGTPNLTKLVLERITERRHIETTIIMFLQTFPDDTGASTGERSGNGLDALLDAAAAVGGS